MKILISLSHPYMTGYNTLKTVLPYLIEAKLEYGIVTETSLRNELLDHGIKGDDAEKMVSKMLDVVKKDPQLVC